MISSSSESGPEVKNTLLEKRTIDSSNSQTFGTEKGDYTPLLWTADKQYFLVEKNIHLVWNKIIYNKLIKY